MSYCSVLFPDAAARNVAETAQEPACFRDLNLDQVVVAITAGREEYDLTPFFHALPDSLAAIQYRQAVVRDLQNGAIRAAVHAFGGALRKMRAGIWKAEKSRYPREKQRWFLEAADAYGSAVETLQRELNATEVRSEGLRRLQGYLAGYVASEGFATLIGEVRRLKLELGGIRYRLHIDSPRIEVRRHEAEPDYGERVAQTFEKFRQGDVPDMAFEFRDYPHLNHVEAAVLDCVAELFSEPFAALERFSRTHEGFPDATILAFDREVQFYLAVMTLFERMGEAGLPSCIPQVGDARELDCHGIYDLSLAVRLKADAARIVLNDVDLAGAERILIVSGANQGGKTTFARTVGQLHYMARLGCPVAAREAKVALFDRLFTHFERAESLLTLRSKLEDDLVRIHSILEQATPRSVLIMNESFGSAMLQDALFLGRQVMHRVMALDLICVFVTFLDELSTLGPQAVSMVSTVAVGDAAQRTFKVLRMPANGLAHAATVAGKYGLGYESVKRRTAS